MANIFINGLGRIGRSILRSLSLNPIEGLTIVGLNDIAEPALCAHLFAYDSTFGPFPGMVTHDAQSLTVNDQTYPLYTTPDLSVLDLSGVDLVLECIPKLDNREIAERGLKAGAKRILISGPSETADETIVLGANDHLLKDQRIISNASCTTNALAPLLRLIEDHIGIESGWMTTIHCYTGSQPTIDAPRGDFQRSRAAALSMVPTTTSAMRLIDYILPDIAGRIEGAAIRVPTASVSAIDLSFKPKSELTKDRLLSVIAQSPKLIGLTDKPLVSTDLKGRGESLIVSSLETHITKAGLVRVFGWYDNEWGFSQRMIEMAQRMSAPS